MVCEAELTPMSLAAYSLHMIVAGPLSLNINA